jgi:hypothetical protein
MNCKQGDLAIYVGSPLGAAHGSLGFVTRVVRPAPGWPGAWEVCPPLPSVNGTNPRWVWDTSLRPLRPGEGDDETLSWAGKPEKVAA